MFFDTQRRLFKALGTTGLLTCLGVGPASHAAETTLFTRTYIRETGPPVETTDVVPLPEGVGAPYLLRVQNGLPDGSHRVSSATVTVNAVEIVHPSDLNQNVDGLSRSLDISGAAIDVKVRLASAPGSQLTLSLVGTSTQPGPLPPASLEVFASFTAAEVRFPPSPSEDVAWYRVYRGTQLDQLGQVGTLSADQRTGGGYVYLDAGFRGGTVVFYAVSAADSRGVEGQLSESHAEFVKDPNAPWRLEKIDGALNMLYEIAQANGDLTKAGADLGVAVSKSPPYRVAVTIYVDREPFPARYLETLNQLGVKCREPFGNMVYARLPIERLPVFSDLSFVTAVEPQELIWLR